MIVACFDWHVSTSDQSDKQCQRAELLLNAQKLNAQCSAWTTTLKIEIKQSRQAPWHAAVVPQNRRHAAVRPLNTEDTVNKHILKTWQIHTTFHFLRKFPDTTQIYFFARPAPPPYLRLVPSHRRPSHWANATSIPTTLFSAEKNRFKWVVTARNLQSWCNGTHKSHHPPIKQPNSESLRPELISAANIGHVTCDMWGLKFDRWKLTMSNTCQTRICTTSINMTNARGNWKQPPERNSKLWKQTNHKNPSKCQRYSAKHWPWLIFRVGYGFSSWH